ncbi:MAG: STAS/SEC14 domain-containing protein [Salinimicrobium sp.]
MKTSFEFSDNILGVILEKKIDSENIEDIQKMLEEKINRYKRVSIYLEDRHNDGITLMAVLKDLTFEVSRKGAFQKIAVVTDAKFFKLMTELKEKLVAAEVESFDREDRMRAMNWVMQ